MPELIFIVITGFAVLGAYFLCEVLLGALTKDNFERIVILFPKQQDAIGFDSESQYIQNLIVGSKVYLYQQQKPNYINNKDPHNFENIVDSSDILALINKYSTKK